MGFSEKDRIDLVALIVKPESMLDSKAHYGLFRPRFLPY